MSGGCSAPHAWASPCAMRLIALSTFSRTAGSKVRTLSVSSAWSEMMFSFVPARTVPTVTTAESVAAMLRETTVCSFMIVEAAITTGSTDCSGAEPCAPRPCNTILSASLAVMTAPGRNSTQPAGAGVTCWPKATSGMPNRANRPSSIIAVAPPPISSAGWMARITLPCHASRCLASWVATPIIQVACMSCPQAWATGTSVPSASIPVAVLAYGSPVASFTGSASMSARSSTVWPSPLSSVATTPVRPTPVLTS